MQNQDGHEFVERMEQMLSEDLEAGRHHTKMARRHLSRLWRIAEKKTDRARTALAFLSQSTEGMTTEQIKLVDDARKALDKMLRDYRAQMFFALDEDRMARTRVRSADVTNQERRKAMSLPEKAEAK